MKISVAWLNEYLDRPTTPDEVERLLTAQAFPIESTQAIPGVPGGPGLPGDSDAVVDVEVTSNRPDCLCHLGLAREVASGSGRTVRAPDRTPPPAAGPDISSLTRVENTRTDLCPVYTARVVRGVKVGPSPAWLVRRLAAIGQPSVSNVVDITNYVLFELGQPLHAFDLARLAERRIVVRPARDGEPFEAIDRTRHTLSSRMLVIADADKPVAIAGVMGGLGSEITAATTDVLIESAVFDPLSVRRTSRALKLASDSSYRFERGVDPAGVEAASARAAGLIVELAGGEPARGFIRVGHPAPEPRVVAMRVERCRQVMGVDVPAERMTEVLARLGLSPRLDAERKIIACVVPTFRLDLTREIDLIEEVARVHGYGHVPVRERIEIVARPMQPHVQARRELAGVLVAHGYHETVNFSFVRPQLGEPFLPAGAAAVLVDDERRKAEPMLRPSLLPSLMVCRKANQDVGNAGVRLFEAAATWSRNGVDINERQRLGLLADAGGDAELALRDLRGTVEELIGRLGGEAMAGMKPVDRPNFAAAAEVSVNGVAIGTVGLVAPATQRLFELQSPVVAAELDAPALLALFPPGRPARPLARFPGIERDLSLVLDEAVRWEQVESAVRAAQPALLEELCYLVTYRGKPVPAGKKSVSLRLTFRDPAATLRHEQVDPQVATVVERLKATLGAELRG